MASREPQTLRRVASEQAAALDQVLPSPSPRSRALSEAADVHYTVFVRLPFPRRDFVDPPLVNWDQMKDRALWQILSNNPSGGDLDWKELAMQFEVTLPFILQQAAWLYERQLSQVRAQMRKVGKVNVAAAPPGQASPRHGSVDATPRPDGMPLMRAETAEGRPPSSFSARMQPGVAAAVAASPESGSVTAKPRAPPISRTASTNTVTQSRPYSNSSTTQQGVYSSRALRRSSSNRSVGKPDKDETSEADGDEENTASADDDSSSSSSSSSDSEPPKNMLGSQRFRRATRFAAQKPAAQRPKVGHIPYEPDEDDGDEDDEEDETPAFLPYARQDGHDSQDMGATIKTNMTKPETSQTVSEEGAKKADSSPSSAASSAAAVLSSGERLRAQRAVGPFSPKQRAELAGLSPRRLAAMKDGSDGAPSMGSSFSDLDDASVTQSALEEALLSNYQRGGNGASRMSSISQAFRPR